MSKNRLGYIVPGWIGLIQLSCFIALYTVWCLPETILIRNVALIIGATFGSFVIYKRYKVFLDKRALSLWMLGGVFVWATLHLLFLSSEFQAQLVEYSSIWKRALLGFIFAIGMGQSIISSDQAQQKRYWWFLVLGLLMPVLIYQLKFMLQALNNMSLLNINIPEPLLLYTMSAKYYVPKSSYVAFGIPIVGVALGGILYTLKYEKISPLIMVYATIIMLSFCMFYFYKDHYDKNILNGVVIFSLLLVTFMLFLMRGKLLLLMIALGLAVFFSVKNFESILKIKNDFIASIDLTKNENWKTEYFAGKPLNYLSQPINHKYYERFAWASAAVKLILIKPEGFGLIHESFGRLAKIQWPDSELSQSHSGWLDLALGIGIPGILLIWFTFLIIVVHSMRVANIWSMFNLWILLAIFSAWCLSELSQKVYFDQLIFILALTASLSLSFEAKSSDS